MNRRERRYLAIICSALIAAHGTIVAAAQEPPNDALRQFLQQVEQEWPGESYQQFLTTQSLQLMADAIESLAVRKRLNSPTLSGLMVKFRSDIRAYNSGIADDIRQSKQLGNVLVSGYAATDQLATTAGTKQRPVDARLTALRRSAESIDVAQPQRRQPDVIERFFRHASDILREIERQPPK